MVAVGLPSYPYFKTAFVSFCMFMAAATQAGGPESKLSHCGILLHRVRELGGLGLFELDKNLLFTDINRDLNVRGPMEVMSKMHGSWVAGSSGGLLEEAGMLAMGETERAASLLYLRALFTRRSNEDLQAILGLGWDAGVFGPEWTGLEMERLFVRMDAAVRGYTDLPVFLWMAYQSLNSFVIRGEAQRVSDSSLDARLDVAITVLAYHVKSAQRSGQTNSKTLGAISRVLAMHVFRALSQTLLKMIKTRSLVVTPLCAERLFEYYFQLLSILRRASLLDDESVKSFPRISVEEFLRNHADKLLPSEVRRIAALSGVTDTVAAQITAATLTARYPSAAEMRPNGSVEFPESLRENLEQTYGLVLSTDRWHRISSGGSRYPDVVQKLVRTGHGILARWGEGPVTMQIWSKPEGSYFVFRDSASDTYQIWDNSENP